MNKSDLEQFNLPDEPGIYEFRGEKGALLYVGKATSLKDRVRSYFSKDLAEARTPAIAAMVEAATSITWEQTNNVLEALILEANHIKRYQPPYNVASKDNKSFNYLVITKEDFPVVRIVRGRELFLNWKESDIKYQFGPFPHGGSLKEAVKIVRHIFPFRDEKCTPCPEQKVADGKHCKPCFNRQIGLCPGVCSGEMTKSEYARTITYIKDLFSGQFHGLKRALEKDMKTAADAEEFEKAAALRRKVDALTHVRDVSLIKDEHRIDSGGTLRIEAYDVAHTAGAETVGVMTVVADGEPLKGEYRKFKVHTVANDDPGALKELLERRLNHPEWTMPKVIVVDGGKTQLRTATRLLEKVGVKIPVVGVVKDEFHRPERLIGDTKAIAAHEKDILLANNEAHSYAINWHRKRLRRAM